jgi:hypothetical protein
VPDSQEQKEDTDLRLLIERWPKLTESVKKAILDIVQGKQVNIKLIWRKQGYVKTVVKGKGIEFAVDDQFEKRHTGKGA